MVLYIPRVCLMVVFCILKSSQILSSQKQVAGFHLLPCLRSMFQLHQQNWNNEHFRDLVLLRWWSLLISRCYGRLAQPKSFDYSVFDMVHGMHDPCCCPFSLNQLCSILRSYVAGFELANNYVGRSTQNIFNTLSHIWKEKIPFFKKRISTALHPPLHYYMNFSFGDVYL